VWVKVSALQTLDPALEAIRFLNDQIRIMERVGEDRKALPWDAVKLVRVVSGVAVDAVVRAWIVSRTGTNSCVCLRAFMGNSQIPQRRFVPASTNTLLIDEQTLLISA
jgi:hypothetical protein